MKLPKVHLRHVALMLVSLIFTLAMLEVTARLLHMGSGGFWEPHPLYGWRNIPRASGWESCYGECAVNVTINDLGLRDRDVSYRKGPGTIRILILGDSMTAGMQVPLEATFAKVLESGLQSSSRGQAVEVLNAAVNGYGTDNELLYYRHEGHKFQADFVILAVYLANDVYNNSRQLELSLGGSSHKPYFELSEDGELVLQNFPVDGTETLSVRIGSFLKRNFQLPRFIAETLRLRHQVPRLLKPLVEILGGSRGVQAVETAGGSGLGQGDICDESYTDAIQHAWDITEAVILQLDREVRADGATLIVLNIPASAQVVPPQAGGSWYCERPNAELKAILGQAGIPYLDLLGPFQAHALDLGDPLYFNRDFHMNAAGHSLAGEALADFFRDELLSEIAGDE